MPGFIGSHGGAFSLSKINFNKREALIEDDIENSFLNIKKLTINKFLDDKIFVDSEKYTIIIEGVVLNSLSLQEKYEKTTFLETIIEMYEKNGDDFFSEFRGSFSGCFVDKHVDFLILFTDHIGSKQVFYSELFTGGLLFGTEIEYLIQVFDEKCKKYTLNKSSCYSLLTFGFLVESNTMFTEVKKLVAGHYLKIQGEVLTINQYHCIDNTPNSDLSDDEIIEQLDSLFRKAITRAFNKDLEYGYKHLVALSGGLDSRMTNCVAHDLGYGDNIVNVTFSESDYLDETIPKKIARDLKHEWIFKALDNGVFLKNIDEVIEICPGGALYYGLAHGKSCFDLLNRSKFGLLHSGQLGDVIIGTYSSEQYHKQDYDKSAGAYSCVLKSKFDERTIPEHYPNEEMFKIYTRGFSGINQGLLISQEFGETYSPFYDLDFMEFCLKIPVELRFGHKIYKKWLLEKYPQSAEYVWEKTGCKVSEKTISILGRDIHISQLPKKAISFLSKKLSLESKSTMSSRNHMNPLDYWYKENTELKKYLDNYFEENIPLLEFEKELQTDCKNLYLNYSNIEKNQVLTLLGVIKRYFK